MILSNVSYGVRYARVYRALIGYSISPYIALRILVDASRHDPHAFRWISLARNAR